MRQLHHGAQRHVPEVRHLRLDERLLVSREPHMAAPDFTSETKQILRDGVGGHCSICDVATTAASVHSKGSTVKIGDAAHISDARPPGKRFESTLTDSQRADPENGIWLCVNCHRQIDSDSGRNFTIPDLKRLKLDAEARARERLGKSPNRTSFSGKIEVDGLGDLIGLDIGHSNVVIEPGTSVKVCGIGRLTAVRIG